MVTVETLKAYGADVDAGVARCMGLTDFYLRLVNMEMNDGNFTLLSDALARGDARAAFEAAHALKGAVGNLALTPLYGPICEITEKLRHQTAMPDTGDLLPRIQEALAALKALAD